MNLKAVNSSSEKYHYAFLIVPNFSIFPITSVMEVLRMANQMIGEKVYTWELISFDQESVESSCGMEFHPKYHTLSDTFDYSAAFVFGGIKIHEANIRTNINGLQQLANQGVIIGSFGTGSYLLAIAGLLDGYQCTIHWNNINASREQFPSVGFRDDIYLLDRDRYTCAGGAAAIDMMLGIITKHHGADLTALISDQLLIDRVRTPLDHQRVPLRHQFGMTQPKLIEAAKLMISNLEEPLSVEEIAEFIGLSRRQVQRLFRIHLNCTPTQYYNAERLKIARRLLMQTDKSILDISITCGFGSSSTFSKSYSSFFGLPPSHERKQLLLK